MVDLGKEEGFASTCRDRCRGWPLKRFGFVWWLVQWSLLVGLDGVVVLGLQKTCIVERVWMCTETKALGHDGGQLYLCLCTEIANGQNVGQVT